MLQGDKYKGEELSGKGDRECWERDCTLNTEVREGFKKQVLSTDSGR